MGSLSPTGFKVNLAGAFGNEFGTAIVIDLDTPFDSGIYTSTNVSWGLNAGRALGIGYARGDIEGSSVGVDVNFPAFSLQLSLGDDDKPVAGISFGPGWGASVNVTTTTTDFIFR